MASLAESKCNRCRDIVEEGDEAVFVPSGEYKDRFFHSKCVAKDIRRSRKYATKQRKPVKQG